MPRMRFAGAVAAVVAALTGLAAAQGAPQGSLTQPRGSDGCAKSYTRPNEACLQVPFLLDARDVATDEGGNFVYVVTSGGLHVLASPFWMRRELTVLPGKAGCWINDVRQTECSELAGSVLDLSSVALRDRLLFLA